MLRVGGKGPFQEEGSQIMKLHRMAPSEAHLEVPV